MDKPLLIFDGDCGFCRLWITRWKSLTGGEVQYAPSQEVGKDFPDIPPEAYRRAVQLIEPDGRRCSGAEAVFRTLRYAGSPGWLWVYENIPGASSVSEFGYSIVSGHRPIFSRLTAWFWGDPGVPSSYRVVRWVFLRGLAVIYAAAFWSYGLQIKGLNGSQGILPAGDLLTRLARFGALKYWYVPTFAWLNTSDAFLIGLCIAGVGVSFFLLLNIAPRLSVLLLWSLYLSVVSIGGDFMNFQWDALLLETGFLAIFLAPSGWLPQWGGAASPRPAAVFLLRWLLFRLMLQSALVKWLSGDLLWRHFTALTVHFQTQPLPNPLSWFAHQCPMGLHKTFCIAMFVIEGLIPFLIFTPRRTRLFAFWMLAGFQGLILLTGNYAYFNWLAILLCVMLMDDESLRRWLPGWCEEPLAARSTHPSPMMGEGAERPDDATPHPRCARPLPQVARGMFVIGVIFLTAMPFAHLLGFRPPDWMEVPLAWVSPLRSFNSYGLFAVMTPTRPEILLEGSDDGKTWTAYDFKFKPGDLSRRPAQVAPYQPRLDWQMWFAALGDYRQNLWFINFCIRILQGSKPVLALLQKNPFPARPPVLLRATLYEYRFTTPAERRQTGRWWARDQKGLYCPVLSLRHL